MSRFEEGWSVSISCDPGWDDLIASLDRELSEIDNNYVVHQVKEKFGGLRFYFDTQTDKRAEMNQVVRKYEELSQKTCELTGEPGILMSDGRTYKTLNPETAPAGFAPVD